MRTVILILGLLFISCLSEHWGIKMVTDTTGYTNLSSILLFAVVLDFIKK